MKWMLPIFTSLKNSFNENLIAFTHPMTLISLIHDVLIIVLNAKTDLFVIS
jgi:hypothetical protein